MLHEKFWDIVEEELDEPFSSKYEDIDLTVYTKDIFDPDHYFNFLGEWNRESVLESTLVFPVYSGDVSDIFKFYLSFLSQIFLTDFVNIDNVIVLTRKKYYDIFVRILKPFLSEKKSDFDLQIEAVHPEDLIVPKVKASGSNEYSNLYIPRRIYKYFLTIAPQFRRNSTFIICSPDNYFYNENFSFYKNLIESLKGNGPPILSCEEKTFNFVDELNRHGDLFFDVEEGINWFCRRLNIKKEKFKSKISNKNKTTSFNFIAFNKRGFSENKWRKLTRWARLYNISSNKILSWVYLTFENKKYSTLNQNKKLKTQFFNTSNNDLLTNEDPLILGNNINLGKYYKSLKENIDDKIREMALNSKSIRSYI